MHVFFHTSKNSIAYMQYPYIPKCMVELCSLTMVGARNKYVTDAHNICSMTSRAAARGQQATILSMWACRTRDLYS